MRVRITTCVLVALACAGSASGTHSALPGTIVFASDRADDLGRSRIFIADADGRRLFVDFPGEDTGLTLSPGGQKIAFLHTVDGQTDLWIARVDGTHPRRLTSTKEPEDAPAWSPNGRLLAFSVCADGGCRRGIEIVGVNGRGLRRVVDDAHAPSFSPNGKELVYEGETQSWGDPASIDIVSLDGGTQRRLAATGQSPSWSPRTDFIVFRGACGRGGSLCLVRADGSELRALASAAEGAWSPDGQRVAVTSSRGLGLVSVSEPQAVDWLAQGKASSPSWSRNGRRIAFAWRRSGLSPLELTVISADGASARIVAAEPPATRLDGLAVVDTRVVYAARLNANDYDLFVLEPSGEARRLTDDVLDDRDPSWSPDRSQIVFVRSRPGAPKFTSLWLMHADGTHVRRLTAPIGAFDSDPTWSPDGTTLAFVRRGAGAPMSRIELLDLRTGRITAPPLPPGSYSGATWSADGRWLAVVQGTTLALVHPDGAAFRAVATSAVAGAGWSPDSAALGFVRALSTRANGLAIFDLATGSLRTIAGGALADGGAPTWSPDGARLAFVRGADLYTVAADGTGEQRLTQNQGANVDPDWR
jgi:Tol biopolymer transport system component